MTTSSIPEHINKRLTYKNYIVSLFEVNRYISMQSIIHSKGNIMLDFSTFSSVDEIDSF